LKFLHVEQLFDDRKKQNDDLVVTC
jgi:hypothetical protein